MSDKIFKRINVGDEKQEIWVLESKLKINDFFISLKIIVIN